MGSDLTGLKRDALIFWRFSLNKLLERGKKKPTPAGLGVLFYPQSQIQSKRDSNFSVFATETERITVALVKCLWGQM